MRRIPAINDEIDKLRHSATAALSERRGCDYCGVACPVSMVWAVPIDYQEMVISLRPGMTEGQG